ncbi:hypothetical protein KSP40_PGU002730 [Platanthera guangdongensis]|uniref:Large ribosomal subunit protein bL21m n=1 Tax=Platanthera guangdongensis TaxID=2320717 RepID=A0ABR2LKV3_9ASPA
MAARRLAGSVTRHFRSLNQPISRSLSSQALVMRTEVIPSPQYPQQNSFSALHSTNPLRSGDLRKLSSRSTDFSLSEDEDREDDDGDEVEEGESCDEEDGSVSGRKLASRSGKSKEEMVKEAAEIGYSVVGPLTLSENPFKLYEPAFAIVQIGSHQFKVCNGDSIFTERLKYCEVNDKNGHGEGTVQTVVKVVMVTVGSRKIVFATDPCCAGIGFHFIYEEDGPVFDGMCS